MTKKEMRENTKELYETITQLFVDDKALILAKKENIFDDNFVKAFVLLLHYFKCSDVPEDIIQECMDGEDIPQDIYETFYSFIQNKWLRNAYKSVGEAIKEIENMKD